MKLILCLCFCLPFFFFLSAQSEVQEHIEFSVYEPTKINIPFVISPVLLSTKRRFNLLSASLKHISVPKNELFNFQELVYSNTLPLELDFELSQGSDLKEKKDTTTEALSEKKILKIGNPIYFPEFKDEQIDFHQIPILKKDFRSKLFRKLGLNTD